MKNDYDFLTFVMFEQHRLWQGTADHRRKSVRKAEKFSNFRDYGTRALNDFKPHDIHDFFDSLTREGLSDNTVNHYAAMLTRVFNHAVNEEHITHAPKFTWKAVKTNSRPLFFTDEQLEKMEAYFKETDDAYMTHTTNPLAPYICANDRDLSKGTCSPNQCPSHHRREWQSGHVLLPRSSP